MAKFSLEVGDRLIDRTSAAIEAEVTSVSEFMGMRHYAFRVTTPGTAPREISLSETGAYIKFTADTKTRWQKTKAP